MNAFIIYKDSCGMDEYFRENVFVTLDETTADKFVSDKNQVKASAFKKLKEYYKIKGNRVDSVYSKFSDQLAKEMFTPDELEFARESDLVYGYEKLPTI